MTQENNNQTTTYPMGGAPRITEEHINQCIVGVEYFYPNNGRTTICVLTLLNGTAVIGESHCVYAENYVKDLDEKLAFDNAKEKIWQLEGYLLRQTKYVGNVPGILSSQVQPVEKNDLELVKLLAEIIVYEIENIGGGIRIQPGIGDDIERIPVRYRQHAYDNLDIAIWTKAQDANGNTYSKLQVPKYLYTCNTQCISAFLKQLSFLCGDNPVLESREIFPQRMYDFLNDLKTLLALIDISSMVVCTTVSSNAEPGIKNTNDNKRFSYASAHRSEFNSGLPFYYLEVDAVVWGRYTSLIESVTKDDALMVI